MDDMLPVFAVNTFGPFVCCREAARQVHDIQTLFWLLPLRSSVLILAIASLRA